MNQDLAFNLKASVSGQQAIDKFKQSLEGINSRVEGLNRGFKLLAEAFALKEAFEFGKGLIEVVDGLDRLSQKTGIGINALSGYQVAAEKAGLSTGDLDTGLKKFNKTLVEAQNGNYQSASAFKNLGITIEELKTKSPEQIINKLADNFTKLKDGPEKAANALKIFGKAGTDLIPFLNQGSEALSAFSLDLDKEAVEKFKEAKDAVIDLAAAFKKDLLQSFEALLPSLLDVVKAFKELPGLQDIGKAFFEGMGHYTKLLVADLVQMVTTLVDMIDKVGALGTSIKALGHGDLKGAEDAQVDVAIRSNERQRTLDKFHAKIGFTKGTEGGDLFGNDQVDQFAANFKAKDDAVQAAKDAAAKRAKTTPGTSGIGDTERDRVKEFIALKQLENDQLKESINDNDLNAVELQKVHAARKLDIELIKASKGLNPEQTAAIKKGTEAIKEQREALIELEYQHQRTFGYGAKKAFDDYVENASNAAKNAERLFSRMFQGMEDALVDFVKTGELNFKKFANIIIDEMIRISIRQAVLAPIIGGLGSIFFSSGGGAAANSAGESLSSAAVATAANGGIMTSRGMAHLKTYSRGGVANSPQMAIFGEGSTPEAYVPLPDGRRIPVNMKGGGGGGDVNVSVNVNMGTGETSTTGTNDQGKQIGKLIASAVTSELLKQKRPGGLIAK